MHGVSRCTICTPTERPLRAMDLVRLHSGEEVALVLGIEPNGRVLLKWPSGQLATWRPEALVRMAASE